MNNICFCAKPASYFHEDMPITKECIAKGKELLDKAANGVEHTPFDGLIEKPVEAVKAVEHTPFDGLIEKTTGSSVDSAALSEAYKAAIAPFAVPNEISAQAAETGYNEFRSF